MAQDFRKLKKFMIVGNSSDALGRYFTEIRSYEPLTKEEERELIIIIQGKKKGHERALDALIKANLKFVVSIAKQYQGQGSSLMDLISEGNAGMCEAIKSFDISQNLKFFSYAVWWIRKKIFISLYNDDRTIRLPDNRALLVTKIKREIITLEQKLQRSVSLDDLYEHLKGEHTLDEISEAMLHGTHETSIHDELKQKGNYSFYGDESTMEDVLEDHSTGTDQIDRTDSLLRDLQRFYYNLGQRQFDVLCLFLGLNGEHILKSSDIAKALGMKEKEVIRLRTQAVARMKKLKNINSLRDYL
jgi:RNA polymerase primary sigma factor